MEVFRSHNIRYFFYNGGGDSQDTADKLASYSKRNDYDLSCIGIPKTVDNDLPYTDCCPGFGSVAKYVAIATREASFDVASMCETSTKVFVLEVIGRHADGLLLPVPWPKKKSVMPLKLFCSLKCPLLKRTF